MRIHIEQPFGITEVEAPFVRCGRSAARFLSVYGNEPWRVCALPANHPGAHLAYTWPRDTASGEMEEQ